MTRKQALVEEELKCVDLINAKRFDEALENLLRVQKTTFLPQRHPHSL